MAHRCISELRFSQGGNSILGLAYGAITSGYIWLMSHGSHPHDSRSHPIFFLVISPVMVCSVLIYHHVQPSRSSKIFKASWNSKICEGYCGWVRNPASPWMVCPIFCRVSTCFNHPRWRRISTRGISKFSMRATGGCYVLEYYASSCFRCHAVPRLCSNPKKL